MATQVHHEVSTMGTVITLDLFDAAGVSTAAIDALEEAERLLRSADRTFSTWDAASPMSRVRRGELDLADAPSVIAAVLETCRDLVVLTEGYFDPWSLPGGVDPTGYVKGWAAAEALAVLEATGVAGAIVNAAGDVCCSGHPSGESAFRVGIVNPFAPGELCAVVRCTAAIATSGTYERGAHLHDPHLGQPKARVASASVTGPDLGMADAFATALAVAGPPLLEVVAELAGYEAMCIGDDGELSATPGFPFDGVVPRNPTA